MIVQRRPGVTAHEQLQGRCDPVAAQAVHRHQRGFSAGARTFSVAGGDLQDAGVQDRTLVQSRAQRPVQAVLKVEVTAPLDHVGEEVAVERGVLREQGVQIEHRFRGDQRVEPDLSRRYLRPLAMREAVLGVGPFITDQLEDHTL